MIFSHEELDAYRLSELEQREHAKRHLTVVRAQMEELYKQVGGIMHELMEDEFYYESVKSTLEDLTRSIAQLTDIEERLMTDIEVLGYGVDDVLEELKKKRKDDTVKRHEFMTWLREIRKKEK